MNNGVIFTAGGIVGFCAGVLACKSYFDRHYREIADSEIASVMERYGRKKPVSESTNIEDTKVKKPHLLKESVDPKLKQDNKALIAKLGYSQEEDDDQAPTDQDPYVIDPDDFGSIEGYDTVNFTYFADGTLVDDMEHQLNNDQIEASIGLDSLDRFGEYEDDSVHVRNDHLKIDYEILKDERTYADAMRFRPHMEEDE